MLLPINYTVEQGTGTVPYPYATSVQEDAHRPPQVIHLKQIFTAVHDMRISPPSQATLMESGFEVLWNTPNDLSYEDFGLIIGSDERFEVTQHYRTGISQLLRSHLGASRVVDWNHHIRRSGVTPATALDHPNSTFPAARAHVDQSDKRAREMIANELGFEKDEGLREWVGRGGRAALVNFWRPLKGPVRFAPLVVCDGRSLHPAELRRCEDYFGEHFSVGYNGALILMESQRWYYISDQMPTESILILCYDTDQDPILNPGRSQDSQRAACCPHTASVSSEKGDQRETRESIEVRTYVFWDPPDTQDR